MTRSTEPLVRTHDTDHRRAWVLCLLVVLGIGVAGCSGGSFTATGHSRVGRMDGAAALLPDGRVLIFGRTEPAAELYDPKTATFTDTGAMSAWRGFSAVTALEDGRVLVTGAPGIAGALASALAAMGLHPVHLRTHEERLDAIYARLVHAAAEAPVAAPESRAVSLAPAPRRSIRRAPGRAGHPRPERSDRDGGNAECSDRDGGDRGDGHDHRDDDAGGPR